ncbi:hypothetical protein [Nocardia higoensis]|uniref:hypothetical protein n=1 Tax=Nocardia higoensis TaxID=228599 RepID=UPI0012F6B76E|nr:hypothetical protein [Nocardia higoensis]
MSMTLAVTGCRADDSEPSAAACPSQVFDLQSTETPLGPPKELIRVFNQAVDQQVPVTTLAEMTSSAGWSSNWDRVIFIASAMTDAHLKRESGTDLTLACFDGLPRRSSNSDLVSPHATVFLSDGKPVQAVWWSGQNPSLDFGGQSFLTPETVFRYNPNRRVMEAE